MTKHRDAPAPVCPGTLRTVYLRVRRNGRPSWARVGVLCDECGQFSRDEAK